MPSFGSMPHKTQCPAPAHCLHRVAWQQAPQRLLCLPSLHQFHQGQASSVHRKLQRWKGSCKRTPTCHSICQRWSRLNLQPVQATEASMQRTRQITTQEHPRKTLAQPAWKPLMQQRKPRQSTIPTVVESQPPREALDSSTTATSMWTLLDGYQSSTATQRGRMQQEMHRKRLMTSGAFKWLLNKRHKVRPGQIRQEQLAQSVAHSAAMPSQNNQGKYLRAQLAHREAPLEHVRSECDTHFVAEEEWLAHTIKLTHVNSTCK